MALCLVAACTRTVRIAPGDYQELKPAKNQHLSVVTRTARYHVESFHMTDSTLVIEKLHTESNTYPGSDRGISEPASLPFAVPLDSLVSVSEVHRPSGATGPMIIVGVLVVTVVIFLQTVEFGGGT